MRSQFIEDHREESSVKLICQVLEVSISGYYAWHGRLASEREMANQKLTETIKAEFKKSGETYGSPRIYQVLRKLGLICSRNRVARLMKVEGLRAKQTKRYRSTTRRNTEK